MLTRLLRISQSSGKLRSIRSEEQMERTLLRERARAERSGCPFALAVMTFPQQAGGSAVLRKLDELLERRLRLTDEAGMLDANRVGVLLGDTSEGGAWKLIRDLCRELPEGGQPKCEVFVYPSGPAPFEQLNNRTDGGRPNRLEERAPEASELFQRPLPTWKRAMDLILGCVMLVMASPLLAAAAIAIKLSSRGPVLFKQQRTGLGGKPFTIYKLRTMVIDAESQKAALRSQSEQDGPAFKIRNDPRITAVGRFLRKSCIDELPQLINVIRGDMSIVGPRPLPVDEAAACEDWEKRRLDVTPGLTCIWQVRGALKVSFSDWMRMDIRYIRRRNLFTDARLVLQTGFAVLMNRASC